MTCKPCAGHGWRRHSADYIGEMRSWWLAACPECYGAIFPTCPKCGEVLPDPYSIRGYTLCACGWDSDVAWMAVATGRVGRSHTARMA